MNLRFRLNLIVTLVLLIILAISAVQAVNNARKNVRAELESAMVFAMHMLAAELRHINQGDRFGQQSSNPFRLDQLANIRHLLIAFYDLDNNLIESNETIPRQGEETTPMWFKQLMYGALQDIPNKRLPVYTDTVKTGELVVSPEPNSEITEAWAETKMLLLMMTLVFLAVNIMVYLVVAHALRPISHITKALSDIESGQLETRLPIFKLPEMAGISKKFNTMAATMQNSILHNQRLTQRIIRLQETERKSLAQELHDEIGQHLTAIHVDASVIKQSTDLSSSIKSARAIDEIACHMMVILRSMLKRLRPGGLDELSFIDALQELIDSWQQRHTQTDLSYRIQGNFSLHDEAIQLTLYRILQECLTNISRHSGATEVRINLEESKTDYSLQVTDNGKGFDVDEQRSSFGISGMQQRVESVNGEMDIDAKPGDGAVIRIIIPRQGEIQ
ncbi:MAG: sensor histidine kinase [Candidatus Thiodiazotropha sp. (ex Ctena orbiculata)]|uniref:histidine kinase n=1 Tax=Candidatus Thiodiazotropha taylori TaxID=2792791 RepID=A0A944M6Q9_9GAMM|nr:sensor histidine kinase [Candidatus Thiodiazotropha taylori]PUB87678.1 MAG: sensor histidine kinase [gamma proteobacterium symbiont of Ctena orbiculata]MBT2989006.1 sensor histidine kinase [Candidatus Thiodiazotropha taylori]MBT2996347.1 sensor histidine kinase [Candidatus Thiodiazotropha taylori]MBT3000219.1 sensor histidine kinase [Candidatus Thiodiazotropha taylori]